MCLAISFKANFQSNKVAISGFKAWFRLFKVQFRFSKKRGKFESSKGWVPVLILLTSTLILQWLSLKFEKWNNAENKMWLLKIPSRRIWQYGTHFIIRETHPLLSLPWGIIVCPSNPSTSRLLELGTCFSPPKNFYHPQAHFSLSLEKGQRFQPQHRSFSNLQKTKQNSLMNEDWLSLYRTKRGKVFMALSWN